MKTTRKHQNERLDPNCRHTNCRHIIDIKGTTLVMSAMWLRHPYFPEKNGKLEQKFRADIQGPEFTVVRDMDAGPTKMTFTISKGGNTITCVSQDKFGPGVAIYHREQ